MDHKHSAGFIEESCVLRYHTLLTVNAVIMIYGKSSMWEGKLRFFLSGADLWEVILACVIWSWWCFLEKKTARLPVCLSKSAVSYCTRTKAHDSQRPFPGLPTYCATRLERVFLIYFCSDSESVRLIPNRDPDICKLGMCQLYKNSVL